MMSDQIIRDKGGRILYRTQSHAGQTKVYDAKGNLLGWTANGQTRDSHGMLVAQGEVLGLLYTGH